jgi:hypothetical protein
MSKRVVKVVLAVFLILVLAFVGLVFGTLTGMNIGGNYFTILSLWGLEVTRRPGSSDLLSVVLWVRSLGLFWLD